jgi:NAD(P)-dependent dehydrogenase (short-subunit alcohol dehydrogenase family)
MNAPDRTLLRAGLLERQTVVVTGAGRAGSAIAVTCRDLGATVDDEALASPLDENATDQAVRALLESHGRIDTLVIDAAGLHARAADNGLEPLRAAADGAWIVTRAVATAAFIPAESGKVVIVAPAPAAGPFAHATRAALENLSRTLSIEWARHQIRLSTIAPGDDTGDDEVATLVAYLASVAGDYFSGCVLSLGEVTAA